jgi:hypothetical protein
MLPMEATLDTAGRHQQAAGPGSMWIQITVICTECVDRAAGWHDRGVQERK